MKQAIIDIGSNSMRLTLYEIDEQYFKILFREKVMAGLAGYVEKGVLTKEGIECAYRGLSEFKETLDSLNIENTAVFATASLRNIVNTDEAIASLESSTGYKIEVISGEEEAMYGYFGAMHEHKIADGAIVDIGGASTEIVTLKEGRPTTATSHGIGSLSLYRECVKNILPGKGSFTRLQNKIEERLNKNTLTDFGNELTLLCVGGTARAVMAIARKIYSLPDDCNEITGHQFKKICSLLFKADRNAANIILKTEPDRIHTLIPGLMILCRIFDILGCDKIIVSRYGVREGYLCQKILKNDKNYTLIHKTGN